MVQCVVVRNATWLRGGHHVLRAGTGALLRSPVAIYVRLVGIEFD